MTLNMNENNETIRSLFMNHKTNANNETIRSKFMTND